MSDIIHIFQVVYCRFIIFVGFLTFRYAYPWPTERHLAKALLMCLPLGYSLFMIKTCGEGRAGEKIDVWILLKGTCHANEYLELEKETSIF